MRNVDLEFLDIFLDQVHVLVFQIIFNCTFLGALKFGPVNVG